MTFDLDAIAASKRAYRRKLAALPIVEKLRMLDRLRERELALRAALRRRPAPPPQGCPESNSDPRLEES